MLAVGLFVHHCNGHCDPRGWVSECPDVKNYKWLA